MLLREKAIIVDPKDTVATARIDIEPGVILVTDDDREIRIMEHIPFGHKFALVSIHKGTQVVKYGNPIGNARRDIGPGELVHTENLESCRGRGDRGRGSGRAQGESEGWLNDQSR